MRCNFRQLIKKLKPFTIMAQFVILIQFVFMIRASFTPCSAKIVITTVIFAVSINLLNYVQ